MNDPWSKKPDPWQHQKEAFDKVNASPKMEIEWSKDQGKSWPPVMIEQPEQGKTTYETAGNPINDPWSNLPVTNPPVGVDVTDGVKTTVIFEPHTEAGIKLIAIEEEKEGKRIVSGNHTHMDKRLLVFECECGEELNPNTTRFAELCNVASDKDWVVEWSHAGYKPYCPKCALEQGKGN